MEAVHSEKCGTRWLQLSLTMLPIVLFHIALDFFQNVSPGITGGITVLFSWLVWHEDYYTAITWTAQGYVPQMLSCAWNNMVEAITDLLARKMVLVGPECTILIGLNDYQWCQDKGCCSEPLLEEAMILRIHQYSKTGQGFWESWSSKGQLPIQRLVHILET